VGEAQQKQIYERKQMKKYGNSITLVLTFGLWMMLIFGCSSFRKAMNEKRAEREAAGITISPRRRIV
jgi:hypothetical protein